MGARRPAAAAHRRLFRQPTDVAWDSQGNIYISDGYVNSRVAKYDQGRRLGEVVGRARHGPGSSTCRTPSRSTATTTSTSAIAATGASRCSTPRANSCACSRSTCRRRLDAAGQRQHAHRRRAGRRHRRAEFDLHHAGPQPGDVRRREHLSRPHLQGDARRQGARRHRRPGRQLKQFSGAHQLACPSETRGLRGRDLQLARAEAADSEVGRSANPPSTSATGGRRRACCSTSRPPTCMPVCRTVRVLPSAEMVAVESVVRMPSFLAITV